MQKRAQMSPFFSFPFFSFLDTGLSNNLALSSAKIQRHGIVYVQLHTHTAPCASN